MYAECCGYTLMSASALCIHVGMSACFAHPFVHQSVASARLSVRLMIVYHCAHRFILRPSTFFSCRGSNDGIAGMCTFLCKNYVYDRQKSTHIFVSDNNVLFHKSFMTVTKGKSQTRFNFLKQ